MNFAFYQLKDGDLSITFASEKDIKDTIIESVDISSGDIGEAPAYLTGGRPVAEEILNHPDYTDEVIHLEETINEMLQEIDTLENESNEIYTKQKQLLKVSDKRSIMGDLNTYSNIQKVSPGK